MLRNLRSAGTESSPVTPVPPIDLRVPAALETATFAVG